MELRHLRYFIAVADEENVSRAALKLHVSQPALSRQIRDLEDELGFSLLERRAKSIHLTDAGRVFLTEARAALDRVEEAVKTARAVATDGRSELHVGYAPSLTARILPQTLRAFQADRPNTRVMLRDFSTEEILSGLSNQKLQIAFCVQPTRRMLRGLHFEALLCEAVCLAVPPNHPLARRRSITVAEALREPIVGYSREQYPEYYDLLSDTLGEQKGKFRVAEEHDSVSSLIAAVEAGSGVAFVSESLVCMAGARLKLVAISPAVNPLVVGAVWARSGLTTAAEKFLECARAVAEKLG